MKNFQEVRLQTMYDVAIIGAGPAGSTAARYLAKYGMNVCLIDKEQFPRDKPCGGGFSKELIDDFSYLKKRTDDFLKGIARVGVLHSPNRKISLQGRVKMALTLRTDFDNVLLESAIEQGVEPKTGKRAMRITSNGKKSEVLLKGGESIKASVIIGSDGVSSMVARDTGLNRKWSNLRITACKVAEIPANQRDIIEIYTDDLHYHFFVNLSGLPGYGWIFPKQDTINIGLGIVSSHAKGLPRIFNSFVAYIKREKLLPNNLTTIHAKGALVPTGGSLSRSYVDNCLLVGDSAGMVSPLTGGGIAYAMRAARFAASVIINALESKSYETNFLQHYEKLWKNDFGNAFRSQILAQRLFTSPFTDLLFEIGKRDKYLQDLVSKGMSESSKDGFNTKPLLFRTLLVCLKEVFGA